MLVLPSVSLHSLLFNQSAKVFFIRSVSLYALLFHLSVNISKQTCSLLCSQPTYLLVYQSAYMPCYYIDSLHTSYSIVGPHVLLFYQSAYMLCFFVSHPTYLLLFSQPTYLLFHRSACIFFSSISQPTCFVIPPVCFYALLFHQSASMFSSPPKIRLAECWVLLPDEKWSWGHSSRFLSLGPPPPRYSCRCSDIKRDISSGSGAVKPR